MHSLVVPILFILLAAVTGWRLRRLWKLSVGSPPQTGVSGNVATAAYVPQTGSPTVELPITPAISAVIASELARIKRNTTIIGLVGGGFFLLAGLVFRVPVLVVGGLAFGLIIGGMTVFLGTRPLERDQGDSVYLRTSGPIQLVKIRLGPGGGVLLKLSDRTFMASNALQVAKALRGVNWATVDHTRHAHLVLEARDRAGRSLYSIIPNATPGWTGVVDPSSGTIYGVPNAVSAVPGAVANPQPPAPPPPSKVPGTVAKSEPIAQWEAMAPPAATGSPSKTKFCLECGKPIPRSSKFCSECGKAQG